MKHWLIRNQARLVWFVTALGAAVIVFILFSINFETEENVTDIKGTIREVEKDLEVERQLREERLIGYTTCLLQTPIELRTDDRVADCRESSGLSRTPPEQPPIKTSGGTAPSTQGSARSSQGFDTSSSGQSFSNSTPVSDSAQPESSQNRPGQSVFEGVLDALRGAF